MQTVIVSPDVYSVVSLKKLISWKHSEIITLSRFIWILQMVKNNSLKLSLAMRLRTKELKFKIIFLKKSSFQQFLDV
jgi:hypothetical protein